MEIPGPDEPPKPAKPVVALARRIYGPLGFARGYNFALFVLTAGASLGFGLARLPYLVDYAGVFCGGANRPGVGECFYHGPGGPSHAAMLTHLAATLPAAVLMGLQFVPVVRRRWMPLHRINGYVVLALLGVSAATGVVLRRRAFGGGLDARVAVVTLGAYVFACLALGYYNVKRLQVEQHRAWMLRGAVASASVITTRILQFVISRVVSLEGDVYQVRSCAQLDHLVGRKVVLDTFPACESFYSGVDPEARVAVRAGWPPQGKGLVGVAAALGSAFGPATWLALALHVLCTEIYLHLTPVEHDRLRNVSFALQKEAGVRDPGRAGLTADKLGDAPRWEPRQTTVPV